MLQTIVYPVAVDNNEIRTVAEGFDGVFAVRNRGLFVLGVSTGGRISELLSLKVEKRDQVYEPSMTGGK